MNAKHQRNVENQATEDRLLNSSELEQRAMQIARDEGRDLPDADDRRRAAVELLAPNETESPNPEVTPELGPDITAWDESPDEKGHMVPRVLPEDENSVGKELIEKGMRGPTSTHHRPPG